MLPPRPGCLLDCTNVGEPRRLVRVCRRGRRLSRPRWVDPGGVRRGRKRRWLVSLHGASVYRHGFPVLRRRLRQRAERSAQLRRLRLPVLRPQLDVRRDVREAAVHPELRGRYAGLLLRRQRPFDAAVLLPGPELSARLQLHVRRGRLAMGVRSHGFAIAVVLLVISACNSSPPPSFTTDWCQAEALGVPDQACLSCVNERCGSAWLSARSACSDYLTCSCPCEGGQCPTCSMTSACIDATMALFQCSQTNPGCCSVCCVDGG